MPSSTRPESPKTLPELSVPPAQKAQYAELRRLARSASTRRDLGRFCVEGPVLIAELLDSPIRVVHVIGQEDLLHPFLDSGVPLFRANPDQLVSALATHTPQPIVAVAAVPEPVRFSRLPTGSMLAMVEMNDPGNAGTMIRTAEAAGAIGVALVGECVDVWNPKVIRASAGSALRLPVARISADELFASARAPIVASVAAGGAAYDGVDLAGSVICVGNEAHGLSSEFVSRCDMAVTIPIEGPTESLNVAAAAAVLMFSVLRQRRAVTLPD